MLTIDEFRHCFSSNEWPSIEQLESETQDQCAIELYISSDIRWFEGHFPDQPVLAGVVQTHWVGEFSGALFPIKAGFSRIDNLKFQNVILPEQRLQLTLSFNPEKSAVTFSFQDQSRVYSSGKLVFEHDLGDS